jgi:histidine phosphotransferase ChpT
VTQHSDKIGALIGSRICHDLISPVGAVANGLELLELAGVPRGPEMALVNESASNAAARIRFFRLAFGDAEGAEELPAAEVAEILAAGHADPRTELHWRVQGTLPRAEVKAALLAILCAEQALPVGGRVDVAAPGGAWRVTAEGPRLAPEPGLWALLEGHPPGTELRPDAVQFALLPEELARQGRNCAVQITDKNIEIGF